MVADDVVTNSTFFCHLPKKLIHRSSKSFENEIIFGTGISVGGLHRLDKFIFKRWIEMLFQSERPRQVDKIVWWTKLQQGTLCKKENNSKNQQQSIKYSNCLHFVCTLPYPAFHKTTNTTHTQMLLRLQRSYVSTFNLYIHSKFLSAGDLQWCISRIQCGKWESWDQKCTLA